MASDARTAPTRARLARWVLWLQLANAALLALLATRYFAFATLPSDWLGWVFMILMVPTHFLLLTALVVPLVLLPALVAPGRWVLAWGVLLYSLLATLILADIQVFALYRFHLNSMIWNLVFSGEADEILPFDAEIFVQAGSAVALVLVVEALVALVTWRVVRDRSRALGLPLAVALVGIILAGQALHVWADAYSYTSVTRQMRYLPWLDGLTAFRFMAGRGWVSEEAGAANTVPFSESGLEYPRGPLECHTQARPRNVLIVAIEEWRFDELDPVTTPNLWRLARQGFDFRNHFSSGNASRYGIFGLLYGLHGTYWNAMLAEQRGSELIAEALRQGYRFLIRGSASLVQPEFDRTAFAQLRGEFPVRTPGTSAHERDRAITDDFLAFLDEPDPRPFFAFLFYDSPHPMDYPDDFEVPYTPARRWGNQLDLDNDTDPEPLLNRHHNAVHYVDSLVAEVLSAVERAGLWEETVVIVTGDHGEEFNDNRRNYWGHNGNFARYQTQVSLVMHFPGRPGERVERMTSHVDVVPTLMREVFGCEAPTEVYSNGRSLFDASPRDYVVASGGSVGIGIIEPDAITMIEQYAGMRLLDHEMRDLDGGQPDGEQIRRVMEEIGVFYAQ